MSTEFTTFPRQQLPFTQKGKAWRKQHLDWAEGRTFFNYAPVRNAVINKRINYDLLNGILHMEDLEDVINPDHIEASFVTKRLSHYPLMNSKLNVLRGEESRRNFDFRVVVTNPNAVSEIERAKRDEIMMQVQKLIEDQSVSEEDFQKRLQEMDDYYTYEWQDQREVRANALLNHYWKELNIPYIFNTGFMDAQAVAEEMYICDIVGGEPTIERLNPEKVRVYRSGYSNKVEDADVIVIEDYWSPGRVIDTYYDVLSKKDMEYIEKLPQSMGQGSGDMGIVDERFAFVNKEDAFFNMHNSSEFFSEFTGSSLLPYDTAGNIRVIRMFWKSRRRIKKVKYYDEYGEEQYNFYPETYVLDEARGEEEEIMWINEAWEGTKIGSEIYVNMRPRVVQYNRLSNPSRCHFGIVGSIYNLNENKPYSLVDMMKPYNYLYDVVQDRLNKLIARNIGKIITLDLAKVPTGWDVEKWLYYARTNNIAVIDSFKEGNYGAATGKLAGALNNASSGVIDAELGQSIQANIELLEYIKNAMSDICGISRQREGNIENRETVGGVERSTLQSSYITEWLFLQHEDVKRRALECFLETAKIAMKGGSKKFQYILSDNSVRIMEIDGDEFAECDYGLVIDNSSDSQNLKQKIDMLAQAALQNQSVSFSSVMKLYNSSSLAEKEHMIKKSEQEMQERARQQQQQEAQLQQMQIEQAAQTAERQMAFQDQINQRDNDTRIEVARINAQAESQRYAVAYGEGGVEQQKLELERKKNEEDIKLAREKMKNDMLVNMRKIAVDREKIKSDAAIKRQQAKKATKT